MSASKKGLGPEFRANLELFEKRLKHHGIEVVMTSGYRSIEEQDRLYAIGRTKPGKTVTNARGGYSWHNFRLAADYAFIINGKVTWNGPWAKFGIIARECGLEWGGDWKSFQDRPHGRLWYAASATRSATYGIASSVRYGRTHRTR